MMMSGGDSSDECSLSEQNVPKGQPPPVPKTPPHAGRVLALKYYKKVSKSIAKFKRPAVSNGTSTTAPSGPTSPQSSAQHTPVLRLRSPDDNPNDHVYEIIPQQKSSPPEEDVNTHPSETQLSPKSTNSSTDELNPSPSGDEMDRRNSTNESGPSEYGSAEEGFENDLIVSSFYENFDFSQGKVNLASEPSIDSPNTNTTKPHNAEEDFQTNGQAEVDDDDEDEDSSEWDTSCGDRSHNSAPDNLCANDKSSSSESSTHLDSSNANVITAIQNTKTSSPEVHRPPPIPKFPSSTEESSSSSADDSFSSCTSKPGNLLESNGLCRSGAAGASPPKVPTCAITDEKIKSVLALSQQKTHTTTCSAKENLLLDSGNETNAEKKVGLAKIVHRGGVINSATTTTTGTSSAEEEDDENTRAPEDNDDNDADDEVIELDDDEEEHSLKTTSEYEEDLVQAVTQTLTLTLNNKSNSLLVSIPSSSSPGGSCSDIIKNNSSQNKTLAGCRRPETGPGNDTHLTNAGENLVHQHEYQNVYVKSGRIISTPIDHNDDTDEEEENDNLISTDGGDSQMMSINRVILSESGVTTIEEGRRSNVNGNGDQYDDDAVPVVHAVINLPPRMMNLIKQRRRRTEDLTYEKSSRLSRLMMADFKAGEKQRPTSLKIVRDNQETSNGNGTGAMGDSSGGVPEACKAFANRAKSRLSSTGSKVTSNVERVGKSVSTMRRKVGSWYQKRVKTPVKQLSTELGIDVPIVSKQSSDGLSSTNNKTGEDNVSSRFFVSSRPKSTVDITTDLDFDEGDYSIVTGEYTLSSEITASQQKLSDNANDEHAIDLIKKGQNEFEDLRRLVKQGGDFCKDLSAVLLERSELESQYAKGLSKLSAKLLKASKEATGSVAHAWQAVAVQIDTQAELHRQWSTALSEELAKPLKNSTDTQHKIRKSVEVLVEKTTRNLADWRTAEAKAKRQCFSSSKEFEKLQESSLSILGNSNNNATANGGNNNVQNNTNANNNATNGSNSVLSEVRSRSRLLSVPPLDKDPLKLEAKRRKAEEAVRRADIEYYTFCVRSERARLEWEGAIRNGSTCLRTLEEEKLSLLRDLALKYFQHLNDFAPKLVHSAETLEEPLKNCSVNQDMHSIVDIRRHVGAEQLLPDFYAEDMTNLMKKERRLEALQKFLYLIKQDLDREKKGATGVETLAKALAEAPKIDHSHHDIADKLYYLRSMLLYLEASRCKLDNAVCDVEGRQRSNNPITQYMRHQRDKQGLPQTILKVPSWAREDCLTFSNTGGDGSAGSSSPDWTDRGNGDGTSGQHDTDFDEFGSEGSGSENIEVFEDENNGGVSVTNNRHLISVPSIGKCRAIYDYDANLFDELTIRIGDEINIHDKQEDGWWLGELSGVIGIFPATYVEELPLDPSPTSD